MGGKTLVLPPASGAVRLAHRGRAPRRVVRGAEEVTGAGALMLHRSLRVVVESVRVEALVVSGMEDGSGMTGIETGSGIGIGVRRHPDESRRLRERRGVTEIAGRRGRDGHRRCLARVHHHVGGGNFRVFRESI